MSLQLSTLSLTFSIFVSFVSGDAVVGRRYEPIDIGTSPLQKRIGFSGAAPLYSHDCTKTNSGEYKDCLGMGPLKWCCPLNTTCKGYYCCPTENPCMDFVLTYPTCNDKSQRLYKYKDEYDDESYYCCQGDEEGYLTKNRHPGCGKPPLPEGGSEVITVKPASVTAGAATGTATAGSSVPTGPSSGFGSSDSASSSSTSSKPTSKSGLSTGAIVGIVIGAIVGVAILAAAAWFGLRHSVNKAVAAATAQTMHQKNLVGTVVVPPVYSPNTGAGGYVEVKAPGQGEERRSELGGGHG